MNIFPRLIPPNHDVMQDTWRVMGGFSWHGAYFPFLLSFVNLFFYQPPPCFSKLTSQRLPPITVSQRVYSPLRG